MMMMIMHAAIAASAAGGRAKSEKGNWVCSAQPPRQGRRVSCMYNKVFLESVGLKNSKKDKEPLEIKYMYNKYIRRAQSPARHAEERNILKAISCEKAKKEKSEGRGLLRSEERGLRRKRKRR
jgi:hypothetical protein